MDARKALAGAIFCVAMASSAWSNDLMFTDSFETGDRSHTSDGFIWSSNSANATISTEHAHTGRYSLKCSYAGKPSGLDGSCEQRFKLGGPHTELWVRWYLRIPDNYTHRADSPSNNKLLVTWSKDYKDMGNRQSIYYWAASDGTGSSTMTYLPTLGSHLGRGPTIVSVPADRGKWFEYTMHWQLASGSGTKDGVLQLWLGKGDAERQLIFDDHKVSNWGPDFGNDPAYNFLDQGYLMGWANSGYEADTAFYIDDVTFSSTPIIDSPKPPQQISVH